MANDMQQRSNNPIAQLRVYLNADSVKQRLEETLGKRAGAFGNSILNVMRNSNALQKCTPESVMSAAMVAATMNLPIDPALGQAAIVPYKNSAQFQIMYRGVIQLCIRSGQYKSIHCSEVYRDELKSYNPLTGEVKFHDSDTFKMRDKGLKKDVVGHYAYFKLTRGFEKSDFMTHEQAMAHAQQYSKAYQYDIKQGKKASAWSTDPIPMGNKTVLMRLMKKYGVMSMDMQDAFVADNSFEAAQARSDDEVAAKTGKKHVDATMMTDTTTTSTTDTEHPEFMEGADDDKADPEAEKRYLCEACGVFFDSPSKGFKSHGRGKPRTEYEACPECKSENITDSEAFDDDDEGEAE